MLNYMSEELLKFKNLYGDKPVINGYGVDINPSIELFTKVQELKTWWKKEIKNNKEVEGLQQILTEKLNKLGKVAVNEYYEGPYDRQCYPQELKATLKMLANNDPRMFDRWKKQGRIPEVISKSSIFPN